MKECTRYALACVKRLGYAFLIVALLCPHETARALAPPSKIEDHEIDAAAVYAMLREETDPNSATLADVAGILKSQLEPKGWIIFDESPREVMLVHPSRKWALLFSLDRSIVSRDITQAISGWGLVGLRSYPDLKTRTPQIKVTQYGLARVDWMTQALDAEQMGGWAMPAGELHALVGVATPWDQADMPENVRSRLNSLVAELETFSLPVKVVAQEGQAFRYLQERGFSAEKIILQEKDQSGLPKALIIPEGALHDTASVSLLTLALQQELNERKFYRVLRYRLSTRLNFKDDPNPEEQLRLTARNLSILAQMREGRVSKKILRTLVSAHKRFLEAWKYQLEELQENIADNTVWNVLSEEDIRALGVFSPDKTPRGLTADLRSAATALRASIERFVAIAPRDVDFDRYMEATPQDEEVQKVLSQDRTLVLGDVEAVDARLMDYANRYRQPYLRVTLRDIQQWDRLIAEPRLVEGQIFTLPGPLIRIIEDGGILVLDYEGTDPKFVAGLNSLFDRIRFFQGHKVSNWLKVVGVMRPERLENFSSDFFSRSAAVRLDWQTLDPLAQVVTVEEPVGETVDVFGNPSYQEGLIGQYYLDPQGVPHVREGKLLEALTQNKPLTLQGVDWEDPAFAHWIRQILRQGGIRFNGAFHRARPGFALYRGREPDRRAGVTDKVIRDIDPESTDPFWVINEENAGILFAQNEVRRGLMTQGPGLLEEAQEEVLRLRIQGRIPDWIWHKILHGKDVKMQIEVSSDAEIPEPYHALYKPRGKSAEVPVLTLENVKDEPVVVLTSEDSAYAKARMTEALGGGEMVEFQVGPYSTMSDLVGNIEVKFEGGQRKVLWQSGPVLKNLLAGKTVVLSHCESNPALVQQLETLMTEQPYLVVNGRRINLPTEKGGRLVLLGKRDTFLHAAKQVSLEPTMVEEPAQDGLYQVLSKEFPKLKKEDWLKFRQWQQALETIPPSKIPRDYPFDPMFTLTRLRRVLGHFDWGDGIRNVFIEEYRHVPEVKAFLEVAVSLIFGIQRGQSGIDGDKLKVVDNQIVEPMRMQSRIWQYADSLSLDLLQQSNIGLDFQSPQPNGVLEMILGAKIAATNDLKRIAFHRDRYRREIGCDPPNLQELSRIRILKPPPPTKTPEEEIYHRAKESLLRQRAVCFIGPPGVGKSFVAGQLAKDTSLGYAPNQIYGPITTGPRMRPDELIQRRAYVEDEGTVSRDEVLGAWARDARGGLLLVDEFNLPPGTFWNFLEGFFAPKPYVWVGGQQVFLTPKHRIIFTGNPVSVLGRKESRIVREHFPLIYFSPLSPAFLEKQVRHYLAGGFEDRPKLAEFLVGLHTMFEKMGQGRNFSLRKLQEVCDRINQGTLDAWDPKIVALSAWRVYKGDFSIHERVALRHLIMKKYLIDVSKEEKDQLEHWALPGGLPKDVIAVPSAKDFMWDVQTFLNMRQVRLVGKKGRLDLQGQRGMLIEGVPARGKDFLVLAMLKARGEKFYHLNASVDYDKVVSTILKARKEGAIVLVSELNLLPSELIEGALNDVLTGAAAPGFAFIATVNSAEFSGREHFSSPLQDRLWVRPIADYSHAELIEMGSRNTGLRGKIVEDVVAAHCWIRDKIATLKHRPTHREIERTLSRIQSGVGVRQALQEVYGPVYLNQFLKTNTLPQKIPDAEEIVPEADGREIVRLIGSYLMPDRGMPLTLCFDAITKHAGYQQPQNNLVGFNSNLTPEELLTTADHEFSHGIFTRHFEELASPRKDPFWNAYMWLEDRRHENAMQKFYPGVRLEKTAEEAFRNGVDLALRDDSWVVLLAMNPRDLFLYTLSSYAEGLLTRQHVEQLAMLSAGDYTVNPYGLALKHLDTAKSIVDSIPPSLDEGEIQFAQYRALVLMHSLKEDFATLPATPTRKVRRRSKEEQMKAASLASENLANRNLADIDLLPPKSVEPVGVILNQTEIQQRVGVRWGLRSLVRKTLAKSMHFKERVRSRFGDITSFVQDRVRVKKLGVFLLAGAALAAFLYWLPSIAPAIREVIRSFIQEGTPLDFSWNEVISTILLVSVPLPLVYWMLSRGVTDIIIPSTHDLESESEPIPMVEPKKGIVPLGAKLSAQETHPRDPHLKSITQTIRSEFRKKLAGYFIQKLHIDKVYGTQGDLDVMRFLTGDPSTAFVRSGAQYQDMPREIILVQRDVGGLRWNPLLEELFLALFEQGFTVTAYCKSNKVQEGIRTLANLKEVMSQAPIVDFQPVRQDIAQRKEPGTYVLITLSDLQALVESEYVYRLLGRLAERFPQESLESGRPPAPADLATVSADEVEQEAEGIREDLRAQGVQVTEKMVWVEHDTFEGNRIIICLRQGYGNVEVIRDLRFLKNTRFVKELVIDGANVEDFAPVGTLGHLRTLCIHNMPAFKDEHMRQIAGGKIKNLKKLEIENTMFEDLSILKPWRDSLEELKLFNALVEDGSNLVDFENLKRVAIIHTPLKRLWYPQEGLMVVHLENTCLVPKQAAHFQQTMLAHVQIGMRKDIYMGEIYKEVEELLSKPDMLTDDYTTAQEGQLVQWLEKNNLRDCYIKVDGSGQLVLNLENVPPDIYLKMPPLPLGVRTVRVCNAHLPQFQDASHVRELILVNLHSDFLVANIHRSFPNLSRVLIEGGTKVVGLNDQETEDWKLAKRQLSQWIWKPSAEVGKNAAAKAAMHNAIPKNTQRIVYLGVAYEDGEPYDATWVPGKSQPDGTVTVGREIYPGGETPRTPEEEIQSIQQYLDGQNIPPNRYRLTWKQDGIHLNLEIDEPMHLGFLRDYRRDYRHLVDLSLKAKAPVDFSFLGALSGLKTLQIESPFFGDEDFRRLTRANIPLHWLSIAGTSVKDISPMKDAPWAKSLRIFSFMHTSVEDATALQACENLKNVDARGSPIASLPFTKLQHLEWVWLDESNVTLYQMNLFFESSLSRDVEVQMDWQEYRRDNVLRLVDQKLRADKDWYDRHRASTKMTWNPNHAEAVVSKEVSNRDALLALQNTKSLYTQLIVQNRPMIAMDAKTKLENVKTLVLDGVEGEVDLDSLVKAMPDLVRIVLRGECEKIQWKWRQIWKNHPAFREVIVDGIVPQGLYKTLLLGREFWPVKAGKVEILGYPDHVVALDYLLQMKFPPGTILRVDDEVFWNNKRGSLKVRPAEGSRRVPALPPGTPASLARLTGDILRNLSAPAKTLPEIFERFSRGGKDAKLLRVLRTLVHLGVINQAFVNRLPPIRPAGQHVSPGPVEIQEPIPVSAAA